MVAGSPDDDDPAARLRVMSFNFWTDHPRHRPAWRERRGLAAAIVRFHGPDVLGGQELRRPMVDELAAALPGFDWVGAGRDDGRDAGEFNPIFYRRARLEARAHGTFWLAPDPTRPARGWGAACPRIVTWAHLRERGTGAAFFHFNTHFDHLSARARRESAGLLRQRVQTLAGRAPAVLTGDLNTAETSAAYRLLTDPAGGLRDARTCGRFPPLGPRRTWRGLWNRGPLAARLDYIFVNAGFEVLQHAVLEDHGGAAGGPRWASDHLPVVADVQCVA